jgi:hypothetical protein
MTPRELWIDGHASFTAETLATRPTPELLAPNERRRAPDAVAIAFAVASPAIAQAGLDASQVASVFASAHGDLRIVDALCATLASDPMALSPTRFHHSVHNAASGYWAIATGCQASSTAVAGFEHSFGSGWLEAACRVAAEDRPVLLVGVDTAAVGPLASVNRSRGFVGVAWVLAPRPGPRSTHRVRWSVVSCTGGAAARPAEGTRWGACIDNALADALAAEEWRERAAALPVRGRLPLGGEVALELEFGPPDPAAAGAAPLARPFESRSDPDG